MASFDESVRLSSDERFEYECIPCKDGGAVREAKHYCPECSKYYCDSCEMSHRRRKATKTHKVLHGDEISKAAPHKHTILPVMYCSCTQSRMVEFFCEEHSDAICPDCKGIHHRKCKISTIQEKSKSFPQSSLKATSDRIKFIAAKADRLHEKQKEATESFSKLKNDCKEQIEAMRQKLHAFVDEIADASLRDMETCETTHSHDNDSILTTTASIKERLKNEEKILQDAISTADGRQMFVADMIVKQKCDDFEKITTEIENEIEVSEISFDEDKTITNITEKVTKLGTVLVKTEKMIKNDVPKVLISMSAVEDKAVSFSPKGACRMTGSTFMPSGDLRVCDCSAKTIK